MEAEQILRRLDDLEKGMDRRFIEQHKSLTQMFQTIFGNGVAVGLKSSVAVLEARAADLEARAADREAAALRSGRRRWDLVRIAITAVVAITSAVVAAVITVTLKG